MFGRQPIRMCADNLIKLSFLFKIFRKKRIKTYNDICISEKQDEKEILDQLEKAQLSSINFMCYGHEVAPLAQDNTVKT